MNEFRNKSFNGWRDGALNTPRSGVMSVFALIAVNVLIMIAAPERVERSLILSPDVLETGRFWQLVTAMFVHANFEHILFNMFALYVFGTLIAPILGARRFLELYFFSGVLGNVLWLLSGTSAYLLGASGAVMGVVMASAMMRPNVQMLLLFIPYPIKLRTLAIIFFLIDFFLEFAPMTSSVAYLAHLGGFLGGYLYMRFFLRKWMEWDPLGALFGKGSGRSSAGQGGSGGSAPWGSFSPPPPRSGGPGDTSEGGASASSRPFPSGKVTQRELDYLLDKISRSGINSLSEAEMERLRQAREQMRGDSR